MLYKKQLEELSALSRKFDARLLQLQDKDILPLSFFSASYDMLKQMMSLVQSVEESQVGQMQQQLDKHKNAVAAQILLIDEADIVRQEKDEPRQIHEAQGINTPEIPTEDVSVELPASETDTVNRVEWKITISDRFLFIKELFSNDKKLMDEVLNDLGSLSSLAEALDYLDKRFHWDKEKEAPAIFRLLLEKTYV